MVRNQQKTLPSFNELCSGMFVKLAVLLALFGCILLTACKAKEKIAVIAKNETVKNREVSAPEIIESTKEPATTDAKQEKILNPAETQQEEVDVVLYEREAIYDDRISLAVLAPFSGEYSKLGESIADAVHLALFDYKLNNFTVLMIDTCGASDGVDAAIKKLESNNVDVIIGPVFSNQTRLIYDFTQRKGITLMSLSNDTNLLGAGKDKLYLLGILSTDQLDAALRHWRESEHSRYQIVYAFVPNNNLGNLLENHYKKNTKLLRSVYKYSTKPTQAVEDIDRALASIDKDIKNIEDMEDIREEKVGSASERKMSVAILLPEGGWRIKKITNHIDSSTLLKDKSVKIIVLNTENSIKEKKTSNFSNMNEKMLLVGLPAASTKAFYDKFSQNYGYLPNKVALAAYDAITSLSHTKYNKTKLLWNFKNRNFQSATGIVTINQDGTNSREFAISEIKDGKLVEISVPILTSEEKQIE
ncbi:hypothetical protein MIDIC_550010 [Alphaproteobacteria bacterium]